MTLALALSLSRPHYHPHSLFLCLGLVGIIRSAERGE